MSDEVPSLALRSPAPELVVERAVSRSPRPDGERSRRVGADFQRAGCRCLSVSSKGPTPALC
jgi:hypothetical protein